VSVERSDLVTTSKEPFVLISREFDAPRELVYRAWTERDHLLRWFAPKGCTIAFRSLDVRAGGEFHSCIRTPDGHECWCKGVYREVIAPKRLVYTMAVADEHGNLVEPVEVGMDPDWPRETIVTITFDVFEGKTKLTLHQTVNEGLAKRTGAHPSWLEMLDNLASLLAGKV
jgi:uncharacterized protein YndB with AHSA1/START domain